MEWGFPIVIDKPSEGGFSRIFVFALLGPQIFLYFIVCNFLNSNSKTKPAITLSIRRKKEKKKRKCGNAI